MGAMRLVLAVAPCLCLPFIVAPGKNGGVSELTKDKLTEGKPGSSAKC